MNDFSSARERIKLARVPLLLAFSFQAVVGITRVPLGCRVGKGLDPFA